MVVLFLRLVFPAHLSMGIIALPLDILASIVDALVADEDPDTSTLRMLSQTCRFMLPLCRRHLFSSLANSDFVGWKAPHLSNLLGSNPNIARYVKSITYDVKTNNANEYDDKIFDILHQYSSSLQSIKLYGHRKADWNAIPEPTKSLLISLVQLPTITHLNFQSLLNFPVVSLSLCCNLVDLQVKEFTGSTSSEDDRVIVRSKIPAPTSLIAEAGLYDSTFAVLRHPAGRNIVGPIIDFSHLKKAAFEIMEKPDEVYHMAELLKMATRLESLYVTVEGPVWLAELGASLAANAHRTLKEATFFIIVQGDEYDPLCGLNLALRQIAGNNVLEELDVDVMVQTDYQCRTDSDDWSDLDTVLTASGAFPMLRKVDIELSWYFFSRSEDEIKESLNKLTEGRFPRLLESTAVAFEFSEEHEYV